MPRTMDILNFLKHYEKHPCLWDRSNSDFRIRVKRDEAEKELLPISGLATIKELRAKIRSIRGTYNHEIMKTRRAKKYGDTYKSKLSWFSYADNFLRKNIEHDFETLSNNHSMIQTTIEDDSCEYEEYVDSFDEHEYTSKRLPDNESLIIPVQNRSADDKKNAKSKRLKLHTADSSSEETVKIISADEEFNVFGQHVAMQLSQLPLAEALQLQQKIQKLLTAARLRCISRTSEDYTFSHSPSASELSDCNSDDMNETIILHYEDQSESL